MQYLQLGMEFLRGHGRIDERENQTPNLIANFAWDVIAELQGEDHNNDDDNNYDNEDINDDDNDDEDDDDDTNDNDDDNDNDNVDRIFSWLGQRDRK